MRRGAEGEQCPELAQARDAEPAEGGAEFRLGCWEELRAELREARAELREVRSLAQAQAFLLADRAGYGDSIASYAVAAHLGDGAVAEVVVDPDTVCAVRKSKSLRTDFFHAASQTAIEVDGEQHFNSHRKPKHDAAKDAVHINNWRNVLRAHGPSIKEAVVADAKYTAYHLVYKAFPELVGPHPPPRATWDWRPELNAILAGARPGTCRYLSPQGGEYWKRSGYADALAALTGS
jgi:hypothetical protein